MLRVDVESKIRAVSVDTNRVRGRSAHRYSALHRPALRQLARYRSITHQPTSLDSASCAGDPIAVFNGEHRLLKIQRSANGSVVFTLSGRLQADNVSELSTLLVAEPPGRAVALDLKDLVLVDRDIVRFLRACEGDGIALRNCPPYIRVW